MSYLQSDQNVQNFLKRTQELSATRAREDKLRTQRLEQEIEDLSSPQRRRQMPSPARRSQGGGDALRASVPAKLDFVRLLTSPVERVAGLSQSEGPKGPDPTSAASREEVTALSPSMNGRIERISGSSSPPLAQLVVPPVRPKVASAPKLPARPGYMQPIKPKPVAKPARLSSFNVTPADIEQLAGIPYEEFRRSCNELVNPVARPEPTLPAQAVAEKPDPPVRPVSAPALGAPVAPPPRRAPKTMTQAELMEEYEREKAALEAKYSQWLGKPEASLKREAPTPKPCPPPMATSTRPVSAQKPLQAGSEGKGSVVGTVEAPRPPSLSLSKPSIAPPMSSSSSSKVPLKKSGLAFINAAPLMSGVPMPNRMAAISAASAAKAPALRTEVNTTLGEVPFSLGFKQAPVSPDRVGARSFQVPAPDSGSWLDSALSHSVIVSEEPEGRRFQIRAAKPKVEPKPEAIVVKYDDLKRGLKPSGVLGASHESLLRTQASVSALEGVKLKPAVPVAKPKEDLGEAIQKVSKLKPAVPVTKPKEDLAEAVQKVGKLKPAVPLAKPKEDLAEAIQKVSKLKPAVPVAKPKEDLPEAIQKVSKLKPAVPVAKPKEAVAKPFQVPLRSVSPVKAVLEPTGVSAVRLPGLANVDWKLQLKPREYQKASKVVLDDTEIDDPTLKRAQTLPVALSDKPPPVRGVERAATSGPSSTLTHLTKGRAKGPRRKLPGGLGGGGNGACGPDVVLAKRKPAVPPVKPKPKPLGPSRSFTGEFFV